VSVVSCPAFPSCSIGVPDPRRRRGGSLLCADASKVPYGIVGAILVVVNSRAQVVTKAAYATAARLSHGQGARGVELPGPALWHRGKSDYTCRGSVEPRRDAVPAERLIVLPLVAYLLVRWKPGDGPGVCWVFPPFSSLVFPLVTYMADRYLLRSLHRICWALAAAVVGAAPPAPRRRNGGEPRRAARRGWRAAVAAGLDPALTVLFAISTLRYSRVWKSSEALWTYASTKSTDYRVFNNLPRSGCSRSVDEASTLLRRGAARRT